MQFGKSALAVSCCLLAGMASAAVADATAVRIKVENFTQLDVASLRKEVARNLPAPFVRELAKGKFAVFVMTDRVHIDGHGNYCVSHVGLTYPQPQGRNPRIPAGQSWGVNKTATTEDLSPREWIACESSAMRAALAHFGKSNFAEASKKAVRYNRDDGHRAKQPPKEPYRMFYTSSAGAGAVVEQAIRKAVSRRFPKAFDSRHLALVVESIAFRLDSQAVCYAIGGVSARSPDDRNPRFPAQRYGYFRLSALGKGDEASVKAVEHACEIAAVTGAVNAVMKDSWDRHGILRNIARTKEADIPLVTAARRVAEISANTRSAARTKVN